MQIILGWFLIVFPGILFFGQVVSSINFELAQKLGLQENPKFADKILQRAERYAAYWDLATLGWMPLAGILMVINHYSWPYILLIAGSIYFDASGREAAKNISFDHEGINIGTSQEKKLFFSTYIIMVLISIVVIIYSLINLIKLS